MAGRKRASDASSSPAERTWFTAHPVTLRGIEPFRLYPRHFRIVPPGTFRYSTTFPVFPKPSAGATPTLGKTTTAYDAEFTTVTDPAGKKRRSRLDGLGRLVRVDEPTGSNGNLGAVGSPNQATSYSYDALDNLTGVSQGSQRRTFVYDSLSRLTSASNPENRPSPTGVSLTYTYDNNGNLTQRTDARGVVTDYTYDKLDRLTRRSYTYRGSDTAVSLGTTRVDYAYDSCGSYSEGRMCSVTARKGQTEVSRTAYNRYDALGRVLKSTQTTGGQAYTMAYAYDRAGNLTSQRYPSDRVVDYVYDGAGRIAGAKTGTDDWYGGGEGDNAVAYEPHGGVRDLLLGNGLWEQRRYNARLQPTQIGLGTATTTGNLTAAGSGLLRLDYSYGTASNNGNVLSQRIRAGTLNQTQSYTYDMLNRLKTARETGSGTGWSQTYQYDRYGNRAVTANSQGTASYLPLVDQTLTPQALTSFNTSSNRLTGLVAYDGSGNLTQDWGTRNFKYDGDNRMVDFRVTAGGTLTHVKYHYDGEGRRIEKEVVGGATTTYVYNVLGQLVAEFGGAAAQQPGTRYLTPDHLGSTRVVTQAVVSGSDGGVLSRHDYLPFGQEIEPNRGNRSAVSGYTANLADGPAQKFTGKERDTESRLDYFGARYFGGAGGRFTSADPYEINQEVMRADSQDQRQELLNGYIGNPQVWNRYAYTLNSPLRFVDPNGECSAPANLQEDQTGVCIEAFISSEHFMVIGYGDNRTFTATDPTQTARVKIFIRINPGSTGTISAARDTATSETMLPLSPRGHTDMLLTGSGSPDEQGNRHFRLRFQSIHGYQNALGVVGKMILPGAIKGDLKFSVTPGGQVSLDYEHSTITGYPSIAGYSYRSGEPKAKTLFEASEKDRSYLQKKMIPVPKP